MNRIFRTTLFGACSAIGLGVTPLAAAQEASDQPADPRDAEIIVTAQKREQNLQDVPISITAVSGAQLEARGVSSSQDLTQMAPGLTIGTTGGNSATFAYIRGGGTNLIDISADPSVATFIDEVYVPGTSGMQFGLLDIERIEVLKGPQGTLFGRNAAAGAISIVTRRPSDQFAGSFDLEVGNYGAVKGRGSITGPLTDNGKLRFRLSQMYRHRDPVTENLAGKDPGRVDTFGTRGQVQYKGDTLDALLTVGYFNQDNGPADVFTFTDGFVGALIDNPAPLADHPNEFFRVWRNRPEGYEKQDVFDTNLRLEFETGLGTLTSITAYRDSKYDGTDDRDGTFADAIVSRFIEKHETFTQELRIAGDAGALQWIGGVYYYHDKGYNNQSYFIYPDMALYPPSNGQPVSDQHWLTTDSYAVFGQLSYDITDRLSLTAGARYSYDKKRSERDIDVDAISPFFLFPTGSYVASAKENWESFNPVVSLQYEIDPDVMIYGSVRSGYKSGGFQTLLPSTRALAERPYDPEKVLSYEIGVRSELFDRRLRLNLSAFYVETKDQQVSIFEAGALSVQNAARSTAKGLDIELRGRITDRLTLNWAATVQKARFGDYRYVSPIEGPIDNTGNRQLRSPDFSSSVGLDYRVPAARGELTLHGDYFFQTRIYFNDANYKVQPSTYQDDYGIFNARLDYETANGRWAFGLWGRNLAGKNYCANIIVWATPAPGTGTCTPGDPRTYGASVRYKF